MMGANVENIWQFEWNLMYCSSTRLKLTVQLKYLLIFRVENKGSEQRVCGSYEILIFTPEIKKSYL